MSNLHLDTQHLRFEEKPLYVPPLDEVKTVLKSALEKNFAQVEVEITDCPDLTQSQYGLMDAGLGGNPTLLEIGGPPYLLPLVQKDRLYNIKEIAQKVMGANKKILAVGAGAGPYPLVNSNCEGIFNMSIAADGSHKNGSYIAYVDGNEECCSLKSIPQDESRCALLLNLFLSQGAAGKIVKIVVKKRTGSLNFIDTLRLGLEEKYGDKVVGMGGLFLLKSGKVKQHVMRDFSKTPLETEEQLNKWLAFYEMPAQLHAVGTLVTKEHDLDLRLTHFHSFSKSNWGGHYHYDTTPDTVEYEAYLNIAERVVRVDKPVVTHKIGRLSTNLYELQKVQMELQRQLQTNELIINLHQQQQLLQHQQELLQGAGEIAVAAAANMESGNQWPTNNAITAWSPMGYRPAVGLNVIGGAANQNQPTNAATNTNNNNNMNGNSAPWQQFGLTRPPPGLNASPNHMQQQNRGQQQQQLQTAHFQQQAAVQPPPQQQQQQQQQQNQAEMPQFDPFRSWSSIWSENWQ